MELVIRQATVSDLDGLVPLFDGYRQFYRVHGELTGSSGNRSLVQASTVPPPPVRIETSW